MVFTRPPVAALVFLFQGQPTKRRNGCNSIVAETAMSNLHLPVEILDHIIDYLHDTEDALRSCCLVSKSWIPRTRKHLFAHIWFHTVREVHAWKRTFPDPSTSPAHYAKTLSIDSPAVVTAVDAEVGGYIGSFSSVTGLETGADRTEPDFDQSAIPLAPFHGFSPAIKSLCLVIPALPLSQVFNLILSFPLLEDLDVILVGESSDYDDGSEEDEMPTATQPTYVYWVPRPLSIGRDGAFLRPSIVVSTGRHPLPEADSDVASRGRSFVDNGVGRGVFSYPRIPRDRLEPCRYVHSSSAVYIDNLLLFLGESRTGFVDLAKATKLKEVVFRPNSWSVEWITTALQTITAKHRDLRQISVRMCYPIVYNLSGAGIDADVREAVGEAGYGEWLELDRLLVQLWESRRIHLMAVFTKGQNTGSSIGCLLSEITKRGMIDLVECDEA
jgi:hypothetical protein